jgi:ribosomal protein S18 acetylase RimI-like enzyme
MTRKENYIIREYRKEDYPKLEKLWKETGLGYPERGDDAKVIERCNALGGKLLVMTDPSDTILIGSSWLTFDGRRIFLHHFGISPEHQNRGLGKELALSTLRIIKELGFQVKLEVHRQNTVAKKLYENLGFSLFPDYDIYMIRDTESIKTID